MKCPRCKGTGHEPGRSTARGDDACSLCARLAEMTYKHVKKMQKALQEKEAA